MNEEKLIRTWKDAKFKSSLNSDEVASLDANPAGDFDLTDEELASVVGATTEPNGSYGCCCSQTKNCGTCAEGTAGCCSS